ncbi:MAG: ABC-type transport auxiliary lipoprotein family protein [Caldimonas sp.]
MSPPGRPKGEYRSAQHEGAPLSPPGRPKDEYRSAQHEGAPLGWRRAGHPGASLAGWACSGVFCLSLLAGCASLLPKPPPPPALFAIDDSTAAGSTEFVASPPPGGTLTLVVSAPRAAAGFDTAQMVYVRRLHQLETFALNQWVDTPARMLEPMIARALERTGAYAAVLRAPSAAAAQLRLDTDLVRLQQDFSVSPSQVRLTLRVVLIETATRQVIASREFDARVASTSEDPYGGVAAAHEAVRRLLGEVAAFCAGSTPRPR